MNFRATLKIEGADCLNWIKEDEETGLVDIYFDTEEGEILLELEPKCFETLVCLVNRFVEDEKIARNISASKGRARPDVGLYIDEEKATLEVDLGELREDNPVIMISTRNGKVNFGFNENQARAIKECCEKILAINEKTREVQKEKIIPAPSA